MFWSFCSTKGGAGTSTVAAATALGAAARGDVTLVDLHGDLPALVGVTADGPGVHDWLRSDEVDEAALGRLAIDVVPGLELVPTGELPGPDTGLLATRVPLLRHALAGRSGTVICDLGTIGPDPLGGGAIVAAASDRVTLVVRACFLALTRARTLPVDVDDVVEVVEGGRALGTLDIEAVLSRPVTSRLPVDPAIARAVDAGTLTRRMPRALRRTVGDLVAAPGEWAA